DGTFGAPIETRVGSPVALAVGDFNGDGKTDLAVADGTSPDLSILLGHGDGTFATPANSSIAQFASSIVTADFNNDGKLDLAITHNGNGAHTVSVLLGAGNGTFGAATDYSVGNLPDSVQTADVNGDGKLDLIVANSSSNTVSVLLGDGSGGFGTS